MELFLTHFITYWVACKYLNSKKRLENLEYYREQSVANSLINQCIITLPFTLLAVNYLTFYKFNLIFSILQLVGYIIFCEIVFYSVHRLLHTRRLYWKIHRTHHTWIVIIPEAALDCTGFEHLFMNIFSLYIGPILFGTNIYLLHFWVFIATLNSVFAHWSGNPDKFHYNHHQFQNCNYGFTKILDRVIGTSNELVS